MKSFLILFSLLFAFACSEIYFQEEFGEGWESRWVVSKNKEADGTAGKFGISAGEFFNNKDADAGLQTTEEAKFYQISAEIKPFDNKGKDLVIQYSVKHEQKLDCGGAYIKLLPAGLNQDNFSGEDQYSIMFGPDICGPTNRRTHVILNYQDKNHLIKNDVRVETDTFTHLYTLIIRPDNTFQVLIDNSIARSGSLIDEFDFLQPREIKDPKAKKPADWVNNKEIDDPTDEKPDDWDDIPAEIADVDAKKPADWDDELDGDWETPLIPNPAYKGEWTPKKIKNPAYVGEWVHPMIANPHFVDDPEIYHFAPSKYLGMEIWQVKTGTIFDNFLVTDDIETAKEWAEKTMSMKVGEKEASDLKNNNVPQEAEFDEGMDDMEGMEDFEGMEGMEDSLEDMEGSDEL